MFAKKGGFNCMTPDEEIDYIWRNWHGCTNSMYVRAGMIIINYSVTSIEYFREKACHLVSYEKI